MTYEENIYKVAEEMAATKHPISFKLYTKYATIATASWSAKFYLANWPLIVDRYREFAIIAVRLQEEAVRSTLLIHSDIKSKEETAYLIARGLIPSPENAES